MAAAPVSLDQGPPLPQQLQPQQASAQQLAGAAPNGSASLQQVIIQKAMFIEQTLNDMATMMPALAGPVNSWIDQFRKTLGGLLAQGAQPPAAGGMGGGMMLAPGGAPTS